MTEFHTLGIVSDTPEQNYQLIVEQIVDRSVITFETQKKRPHTVAFFMVWLRQGN